MELSLGLRNLQTLLPSPLYVVGGAVRDALLGYGRSDIDLAGELTPKELLELLKDTIYAVAPTSMKLGTVKIVLPGESYEYTTFRKDSYRAGEHRPRDVVFTHSLEEDAKRRDFTINSIYWNVRDIKMEDPLCGRNDLREKVLRAADNPDKVLAEDGLRILRMVRIAWELGFRVEETTYLAAKKNAALLEDVSPERLRDEFLRILYADKRHGIENAHERGLRMLIDLGAMQFLIPELLEGKGVEQRKDYHSYTVLEHIIRTVAAAPQESRIAALFHDIAKPRLMEVQNGHANGHGEVGAAIAKDVLTRLKFPLKEIKRTEKLVAYHMFDNKLDLPLPEVRAFVQENYDLIDDLVALKHADIYAKGKGETVSPSAELLADTKNRMEAEGVPMCVRGLKIGGDDLIELKVPEEKRSSALQTVLKRAAQGKDCLTRETQLDCLRRFSH